MTGIIDDVPKHQNYFLWRLLLKACEGFLFITK